MPKQLVKINHSISILSYLALFILADQLFLPVPRLFGISIFKPSYWILLAWPLIVVTYKYRGYVASGGARRFFKMTGPVMGIVICGLLGQLYLSTLGNIYNPNEAFRTTVFYLMMIFAFGFGQFVPNFRCRWLLWLFYAIVALTLLLIFTVDRFPVLAQLYYHTPENIENILVRSQVRHRGLGNPNSTMLLVNIVFLFLVVSVRSGYLSRLQKFHIVLTSTLNIAVCFILASRNQMIASIILVAFFAATMGKHWSKKIFAITALFALATFFVFFGNILRNNYTFIDNAYSRFATTAIFDITGKRQSETIIRPLIHWQDFSDRFLESPLIGSGYSMLYFYPFDRFPNFHNDWFRVWATSGAIGGLLLFVWMFRIYRNFGLLMLLPLFIPGLTNTFLRNTPAVIFYCFMLGILIEKKFRTEARMTISGSSSSFSTNSHT